MFLEDDQLVDTNILMRLNRRSDPDYSAIRTAVRKILERGGRLYYCAQTIAELWSVSTRPIDRNGFGLSITETANNVAAVERQFSFLPESERTYRLWREWVLKYEVKGIKVYDARLAATVKANDISRILTLNGKDFKRYDGIKVVHPSEI